MEGGGGGNLTVGTIGVGKIKIKITGSFIEILLLHKETKNTLY